MGERLHPLAQRYIIDPEDLVAQRHRAAPQHLARPPLAHSKRAMEMATASRSAAGVTILSEQVFQRFPNIASASSRLSLAFSQQAQDERQRQRTEFTSNVTLAVAGRMHIEWHKSPRETDPECLHRELQLSVTGRTAERDAVPFAALHPGKPHGLAGRLQPQPTHTPGSAGCNQTNMPTPSTRDGT